LIQRRNDEASLTGERGGEKISPERVEERRETGVSLLQAPTAG
jgi:hypothetical protein